MLMIQNIYEHKGVMFLLLLNGIGEKVEGSIHKLRVDLATSICSWSLKNNYFKLVSNCPKMD